MKMKTEFNIINFRETIMVYPFSFSFFLSLCCIWQYEFAAFRKLIFAAPLIPVKAGLKLTHFGRFKIDPSPGF